MQVRGCSSVWAEGLSLRGRAPDVRSSSMICEWEERATTGIRHGDEIGLYGIIVAFFRTHANILWLCLDVLTELLERSTETCTKTSVWYLIQAPIAPGATPGLAPRRVTPIQIC